MKLKSAKIVLAGALLGGAERVRGGVPDPVRRRGGAYRPRRRCATRRSASPPTPGYFWIGGAWFWEGNRYNWHPGHWQAPRPGYRWDRTPGATTATTGTCRPATGAYR